MANDNNEGLPADGVAGGYEAPESVDFDGAGRDSYSIPDDHAAPATGADPQQTSDPAPAEPSWSFEASDPAPSPDASTLDLDDDPVPAPPFAPPASAATPAFPPAGSMTPTSSAIPNPQAAHPARAPYQAPGSQAPYQAPAAQVPYQATGAPAPYQATGAQVPYQAPGTPAPYQAPAAQVPYQSAPAQPAYQAPAAPSPYQGYPPAGGTNPYAPSAVNPYGSPAFPTGAPQWKRIVGIVLTVLGGLWALWTLVRLPSIMELASYVGDASYTGGLIVGWIIALLVGLGMAFGGLVLIRAKK